jgi:hypothetical protein
MVSKSTLPLNIVSTELTSPLNAGRAIGWLVFLIVFSYFFIFMLLGGGDAVRENFLKDLTTS